MVFWLTQSLFLSSICFVCFGQFEDFHNLLDSLCTDDIGQSLAIGQILSAGSCLKFGDCELKMKFSGDLVLREGNDIIWGASARKNKPEPYSFLRVQGDSNVVLYGSQGNWWWASDTINYAGVLLAVQNINDDCELRLYNKDCQTLWKEPGDFRNNTKITPWPKHLERGHELSVDQRISIDDKCYLVMRQNGHLQHVKDGEVTWDSDSECSTIKENSFFRYTERGNLEIYDPASNEVLCRFFRGRRSGGGRRRRRPFGGEKLVVDEDCGLGVYDSNCNYISVFPSQIN